LSPNLETKNTFKHVYELFRKKLVSPSNSIAS